jgi:hypothetical protein
MGGARLYAPDLFAVPPPIHLPGSPLPLSIGDAVAWDVQNGAIVINGVQRQHGNAAPQVQNLPPVPEIECVDKEISKAALLKIGFIEIAYWRENNPPIFLSYENCSPDTVRMLAATPALYAFCSGEKVCYIGKTKRLLQQRMLEYQRGLGDATNSRVHRSIRDLLSLNRDVVILAFIPDHCIKWGEHKINLPAALEDTLIDFFQPDWNAT